MKKSKIIVPALGLLLLSTAASVSGTVAWFTANRTYTASAGNFAVVSIQDNLACTLSAGLGTAVSASDETVIELADADYKLTDASFDHLTKKFIIPDSEGKKVGRVVNLADAVLGTANSGNNLYRDEDVYSAFTWGMDFHLTYGNDPQDTGLFFDGLAANSHVDAATGSTIVDTALGFRMAFIPTAVSVSGNEVDVSTSAGVARVWADLQAAANCKYVPGGTAANADLPAGTAYSGDLMDSAFVTTIPTDKAAGAVSTAANYLGTFTSTSNANKTVHLNYTVVVWYEGTDPHVVNDISTVYETVTATMKFGIAKLA